MGAELAFGKRRESSDWWLHSSVLALKAAPLYTESAWSRQLAYSCAVLSAGRSTMGWFPVGVWMQSHMTVISQIGCSFS